MRAAAPLLIVLAAALSAGCGGGVSYWFPGTVILPSTPKNELVEVATGDEFLICIRNSVGQVGCSSWRDMARYASAKDASPPALKWIRNLDDAQALTLGNDFGCALRRDGRVACWGGINKRLYGNAGSGGTDDTAIDVPGITGAVRIASSAEKVCTILSGDRIVACWGRKHFSSDDVSLPEPIKGLTGAIDIDVHFLQGCAARSDGSIACWGESSIAWPASEHSFHATTAVTVRAVPPADRVSVAFDYVCARLRDGSVDCWRYEYGSRGPPIITHLTGGAGAAGGARAVQISSVFNGTCVLDDRREVTCWPRRDDARAIDLPPHPVEALTGATQISMGLGFVCGLLPGGEVRCDGDLER